MSDGLDAKGGEMARLCPPAYSRVIGKGLFVIRELCLRPSLPKMSSLNSPSKGMFVSYLAKPFPLSNNTNFSKDASVLLDLALNSMYYKKRLMLLGQVSHNLLVACVYIIYIL